MAFGIENVNLPGLTELGQQAAETTGEETAKMASGIAGNMAMLLAGIVLIIITIVVILLAKRIIVNSVLGLIGWLVVKYVLQVSLPFWPSLVLSIIFGLAGLGAMLVLAFMGIV